MFNSALAALLPLCLASAPPADVIRSSARLDGPLKVGATTRLVVEIDMKDGWSINKAGIPNAIIQIDAPTCVTMIGERAKDKTELSRTGFMKHPEERMADGRTTAFEFELRAPPAQDDQFEVNVLAYVSPPDKSDAWYVRQRLAISLKDGAQSSSIDAKTSDWGVGDELQLGDQLPRLKLPKADGTLVDLAAQLGKKNIVITTYRAYW
ncbi:MAG: hypothetical protein H6818_23950 [Phycisphaerales bacterium]|nr:hypothetical protein [Phycisphaerales bacterium]